MAPQDNTQQADPHAREYDSQTGGWTKVPTEKPVPGAGNGSQGRLRGGR
ncbi:hypothetical protein ACIP93_37535 [Streptomyces sp. NPDC088745]